jgi:hypothetical protein
MYKAQTNILFFGRILIKDYVLIKIEIIKYNCNKIKVLIQIFRIKIYYK